MLSPEEQIDKDTKIIVFRLMDEQYGVEVNQVKSIERLEHITKVPRTPKFVKGVINLRGAVIPIIDLKDRLDLGESIETDHSRIVIVTIAGIEVGLIVDSATDVIDIPSSAIQPPPQVIGGVKVEYLRGIAKLPDRLLILLNLEKVLDADEVGLISDIEGLM